MNPSKLCFISFEYRKIWRRGGGYQVLSSKFICLTVPKIYVGDPSSVSSNSDIEKVWIRGWGVSGFYVETYLSHSAEIFRVERFSVSLFSGTVKIYE